MVDGVVLTCTPSEKCKQKNQNKKYNEEKEKLNGDCRRAKDYRRPKKIIDDPRQKAQHKQAQKQKKDAEKKKGELEAELNKFKPQCVLTYFGGDAKGAKGRLTIDEIKKRKIEHVFCHCEKVEAPEPSKKIGSGEVTGAGRDRPQPLRELSSSEGAFPSRRRPLRDLT